MVEAKLLRKKLKNGLIVDKWDLVTIIEKQQVEIEELKKQVIGDDYVFVCKRCGDELGIKFEALKEIENDKIWNRGVVHVKTNTRVT